MAREPETAKERIRAEIAQARLALGGMLHGFMVRGGQTPQSIADAKGVKTGSVSNWTSGQHTPRLPAEELAAVFDVTDPVEIGGIADALRTIEELRAEFNSTLSGAVDLEKFNREAFKEVAAAVIGMMRTRGSHFVSGRQILDEMGAMSVSDPEGALKHVANCCTSFGLRQSQMTTNKVISFLAIVAARHISETARKQRTAGIDFSEEEVNSLKGQAKIALLHYLPARSAFAFLHQEFRLKGELQRHDIGPGNPEDWDDEQRERNRVLISDIETASSSHSLTNRDVTNLENALRPTPHPLDPKDKAYLLELVVRSQTEKRAAWLARSPGRQGPSR